MSDGHNDRAHASDAYRGLVYLVNDMQRLADNMGLNIHMQTTRLDAYPGSDASVIVTLSSRLMAEEGHKDPAPLKAVAMIGGGVVKWRRIGPALFAPYAMLSPSIEVCCHTRLTGVPK